MRKLWLLVGAGVGYVLGTKAGRERYEQISQKANELWGNPKVQAKVEEVKQQAPQVANKVTESVQGAADQAKSKVSGTESTGRHGEYQNETGSYDPQTGASVDTTGFGPGGEKLP